MLNANSQDHDEYLRQMFTQLASVYARANHWITWGQDTKWRREVALRVCTSQPGRLLDIGTGTGDLALEVERLGGSSCLVAGDFTPAMMQVGRKRVGGDKITWVLNDALNLPYPASCFDAVVSGYLLRNVRELNRALAEQYRVLKVGGRMVCLDTTLPPMDFWHAPVRWYLRFAIPLIGGLVTGDIAAYRYLSFTTAHFIPATELAQALQAAGFRQVGYRRFMGGCMAIHWGVK